MWDVQKAFELYTDEKAFPEWTSKEPINAPEGIDIEFKLIVTDKENNLHHWE